jgi:O-acetylserine/cysteine efflux transporter
VSLRDFLILIVICLAWAVNTIISKVVVSTWHVPPLMYGALRFGIVMLATLPWLLPMPRPSWRIVLVGLLMGGGTFALLFIGLKGVTPSEAAVVSQAGVPITTLLSIFMLSERVHWRRALGITLTLAGVLIVVWQPGFAISSGMLFVLAAALCGSLGAVMMKQMEQIAPLRFQAWVGLTGFAVLTPLTLLLDRAEWHFAVSAGWPLIGALLFSALIVSVLAHTAYYVLIQRYEANLLAPLTLITPLATIAMGIAITGDQLDTKMIVGTGIALLGVLIVALRRTGAPIPQTQERS